MDDINLLLEEYRKTRKNTKKYKSLLHILLNEIANTNDDILRNKIAIGFMDKKESDAVDSIFQLLASSKVKNNRGTLLYALGTMDYSNYYFELIDLLFDDVFEVSREAALLLNKSMKTPSSIEDSVKIKCIQRIVEGLISIGDKENYLYELLHWLSS